VTALAEKGRFYYVESVAPGGSVYVAAQDGDLAARSLRGEEPGDAPLRIKLHPSLRGTRLRDVVWAELYPLLGPRVQQVLRDIQATGWSVRPISVPQELHMLRDYGAMVIHGRGGRIGPCREHSLIIGDKPGSPLLKVKGWCLDPREWDGSDFWVQPDRVSHKIATRKVRDALRKAKVTGLKFVDLSELETLVSRDTFRI
jgi:hypothetical protein